MKTLFTDEDCFIRIIKLLQVTFYRCFDRLLGSGIMTESFKFIKMSVSQPDVVEETDKQRHFLVMQIRQTERRTTLPCIYKIISRCFPLFFYPRYIILESRERSFLLVGGNFRLVFVLLSSAVGKMNFSLQACLLLFKYCQPHRQKTLCFDSK